MDVTAEAPLLRVPLRLGIWDKGAQIHRQCPGLTELGCLALALLEELSQGSESQRWPWLRVSKRNRTPALHVLRCLQCNANNLPSQAQDDIRFAPT